MSKSREEAHNAFRPLWITAHTALIEAGDLARQDTLPSGTEMRSYETIGGATITKLGDILLVNADFVKPDGTEEEVRIQFPEDIRDLSEATVEIDWHNEDKSGSNTPPLRRFPELANSLLELM